MGYVKSNTSKQSELHHLLQNPATGNPLIPEDGRLRDRGTGASFRIRNGIPVILLPKDIFGWNKKQQRSYDCGSYLYDLIYRFHRAKANQWLQQIADLMRVQSGDYVLETSVGTGQQIRNLQQHGINAHFFGNDISFGMLRQCQKNMKRWKLDIGLVQGNAEALPFVDQLFDVVFHVGGFNFFNDKERAINEMIRVAKPGARIYLVDETPDILPNLPLFSRFIPDPASGVYEPPIDLIPRTMSNIQSHDLLEGMFWLVGFEKPGSDRELRRRSLTE